jgi:hypothetical protein
LYGNTSSVVTIVNSSFLNNTNQNAVVIQGKGSLTGSTFIGNSATQRYAYTYILFDLHVYTSMHAIQYYTQHFDQGTKVNQMIYKLTCYMSLMVFCVVFHFTNRGAAIASATLELVVIDSCYFSDNLSVDAAGGITGYNTDIRNSIFERNSAGVKYTVLNICIY